MVLLLLGPAFVFEARLAMPLRGIQGGVPFALPLGHIIVGVLVAVVQGVRLDRAPRDRWLRQAAQGAARFGSEPGPAGDPLLEWSARAVPRSVPWLRAMQGESAARCVAWTP